MARILIIEDNPANLDLMSYLLQANGHSIVTAQDGELGLAEAMRQPLVDLIVCDVHLPGIDGYEIAHRLKADAAFSELPLVAVTALAMVGDKEKVMAAGFDGYIAKPINPRAFALEVLAYLPGEASRVAPVSAASGKPAAGASVSAPTDSVQGAHILVVDDSPTNRELARATLEPHGYKVTTVSCAAEAKICLEREAVDLILSDVHMPDDSGLQFLAAVRDDPRWRQLPFMLISATGWGTRDREAGLALGADRFLIRPINPQRFLDEIAACLVRLKRAKPAK